MPDALQFPEDDDAAAELLADALVEAAQKDARIRRVALRAAGLAKAPAEMTLEELAALHGTSRHALGRLCLKALQKLRYTPEIRSLKPKH